MRVWLEKQLHLIDFALLALARHKLRHGGLLLIFAALVFGLASLVLFTGALRSEARLMLADAPELIVQRQAAGRHELLPADWLALLAAQEGVQSVQGRRWGYYYDSVSKANYTVLARPATEIAEGELVIGHAVARERSLQAGNAIAFRSYAGDLLTFRVASVLPADSELLAGDLLLMADNDFLRFFGYPASHYTDAQVSLRQPQASSALAATIAAQLPEARVIRRDDILALYGRLLAADNGVVGAALAALLFAFVVLLGQRAVGLAAEERREIGILRAIGWAPGDVLRMKCWEGLLISLAAFLLGFIAAYFHVFRAQAGLFVGALRGWSVLYPDFRLSPVVAPETVLLLMALTVLPYLLAVLLPVWRVSAVAPETAMRA